MQNEALVHREGLKGLASAFSTAKNVELEKYKEPEYKYTSTVKINIKTQQPIVVLVRQRRG